MENSSEGGNSDGVFRDDQVPYVFRIDAPLLNLTDKNAWQREGPQVSIPSNRGIPANPYPKLC